VRGLVGGLLELIFWPPLPKSEVWGQVGVLLEMLLHKLLWQAQHRDIFFMDL
jgi:hypothetical protein